MTKQSDNQNFDIPTRQSYVAILLMVVKIYKKFIKAFWFFLLPMVLGKKGNTTFYLYVIIGISIVLFIYAVIDFFRYKFHIEGEDFVVEKGVFSKKKIVIPFDRIQSINFKQNIIQQVFNVVGLELDTAGTAKKEFDFDALDVRTSNELRDYIFTHKSSVIETSLEGNALLDDVGEVKGSVKILKLEISDLFKIGLTQNHFRSLFFALISIVWLVDQAEQAGVDTTEIMDITEENILQLGLYILGGLMIVALVLVIIVSIVRIILRYYEFLMLRIANGFKLEYGLFNRNEIAVMDNKVQTLVWSDNLIRRTLGLFTLQIKLASSMAVKNKKSIVIPGVTKENISDIKSYYFPNNSAEVEVFEQPDQYYLWRRLLIVVFVFSVISVGTYFLFDWIYTFIPIVLMAYFMITSIIKYGKMKFGVNQEVLQIHNGIFGDKHVLLSLYKLQGVRLAQSPVQKRKKLFDVIVYTASGSHRIKYIKQQVAEKLRDYILYRVEEDRRAWM